MQKYQVPFGVAEHDPNGRFYLVSDVDAAAAEGTLTANAQRDAVIERQEARIAELAKALRDVSTVDLGFAGGNRFFCAACASYGAGPESIQHKAYCVTARTLSLMET